MPDVSCSNQSLYGGTAFSGPSSCPLRLRATCLYSTGPRRLYTTFGLARRGPCRLRETCRGGSLASSKSPSTSVHRGGRFAILCAPEPMEKKKRRLLVAATVGFHVINQSPEEKGRPTYSSPPAHPSYSFLPGLAGCGRPGTECPRRCRFLRPAESATRSPSCQTRP